MLAREHRHLPQAFPYCRVANGWRSIATGTSYAMLSDQIGDGDPVGHSHELNVAEPRNPRACECRSIRPLRLAPASADRDHKALAPLARVIAHMDNDRGLRAAGRCRIPFQIADGHLLVGCSLRLTPPRIPHSF